MLKNVTLRGTALQGTSGKLSFAYRPVALLTTWTVTHERTLVEGTNTRSLKPSTGWMLTGTLGPSVDRFQLRQRPLLFTAPRKGGFFCWPVHQLTVGERTLVATLGPPEY